MIWVIVDAAQKHVLERQPPAGALEIVIGRGKYRLDAGFLIDVDQLVPQFVVRGVQRHSQMIVQIELGQTVDRLWQSDRRNGDSPSTDAQAAGTGGNFQGRQES